MTPTDRRLPRPRTSLLALPAALLAALLSGCAGTPAAAPPAPAPAGAATVTVHRSPTCACCEDHRQHLEQAGFSTTEVIYDDPAELAALKEQAGLSPDLRSCHTSEVAGYFVEGHVPAEVFEQLLDERPPVDALTLPGMPAGSPGMPGEQTEPLVIYAVSDGEVSAYATVAP